MQNFITSWDKPIGTLIETFVDFDKDQVATLQAQLLAIHNIETLANVQPDQKTDLFKLLSSGPNAIAQKLIDHGFDADDIAKARASVDSNVGMPGGVPPYGLIAKITGLVSAEICDELLTVQAAARVIKFAEMNDADVPSLDDAANDKRFGFIGKNPNEPLSLSAAQSYAHLALLYKAAEKFSGEHADKESRFITVAKTILQQSAVNLKALQQNEAAQNIEETLPEIKGHYDVDGAKNNVYLAVGIAIGAAQRMGADSSIIGIAQNRRDYIETSYASSEGRPVGFGRMDHIIR